MRKEDLPNMLGIELMSLENSPCQLTGPSLTYQPTRRLYYSSSNTTRTCLTSWLKGPAFPYAKEEPIDLVYEPLPPDELSEVKTVVQVLATNALHTNTDSPISALIPRFSRWR